MTDAEYHRLAFAVLSRIEATLDGWLQSDVIDIDSQRTGGLLELTMPAGSKIVINTQPPLQDPAGDAIVVAPAVLPAAPTRKPISAPFFRESGRR